MDAGPAEDRALNDQDPHQERLKREQRAPAKFHGRLPLVSVNVFAPSAATARRMIAPWMAFSHCGGNLRKTSAGEIIARSSTPASAPQSVPRPPEITTPPTTAAAMAWSSRPVPVFGSMSTNRIALS